MSRTQYERLPLQLDDLDEEEIAEPANTLKNNPLSPSVARPPTFYGEGSFDPPSSDDEVDTLLEKNGPSSPTSAERGALLDTSERRVSIMSYAVHSAARCCLTGQ